MTAPKKNLTSLGELKFAKAFLLAIGADPNNVYLLTAIAAWIRVETPGKINGNNPLNLKPGKWDEKYRSGYRLLKNGTRYSVYSSLELAAKATAAYLLSGAKKTGNGFDLVVRALKRQNDHSAKDMQRQALDFLVALSMSNYSTSHYGDPSGTIYDTTNNLVNQLVKVWATITGTPALPAEKHTKTTPAPKPKPLAPMDLPPPNFLHGEFLHPYDARSFYSARHGDEKALPGAL